MIYRPGIMSPSWVLETDVSQGMIYMFRQYIYNAKKKFKYKKDSEFLDTIKPNTVYDKPYFYSYDSTLQINKDPNYAAKIEALVKASNEELYGDQKNKFYKYYKFDMLGTWERGYIVLMKPADNSFDISKIKNKAANNSRKYVDKKIKNTLKSAKDTLEDFYII